MDNQNIYEVKDMKRILYEILPYIAILLVCLFNARNIITGTGNPIIRKYGKLTDQEKELYDSLKVKRSQLLYVLSLAILTVLAFVFSVISPNIILPKMFIVCYLVEIVVLLIFSETKWILNLFCKKSRISNL
jgi:thiamine transporter ThiT